MDDEQYIESGLSVGAVTIVDTNGLITEEELNYINNKIAELDENVSVIENELEQSVKFEVVGEGVTVPPINGGGSSGGYVHPIQLYTDEKKEIKGYPITSPDRVIDENGVNIKDEIEEINSSLDNIINKQLTFDDFGAVGDGITDDTLAIQSALDWSKENNSAVYMRDKLYYVTESLRCGNAIIRSISDVPGQCDIMFLQRPDGTYMNGTPDWSYMFNLSSQYTWRQVIENCAVGPAIISDKDIKILTIGNGEIFNVRGFAVIGNHKMKNQYGLCDDTPDKYRGTRQSINNISVIGCGNNGITLNRGFEVSSMNNVCCSYNMGHGLFTGVNNFDSATEYLRFNNCQFANNRLDGVHFSNWRKNIIFENCLFNGNGQYFINGIDSITGYDRRIPSSLSEVHAGVWLDSVNNESNYQGSVFVMRYCYGENLLKGVHMARNKDNFSKFTSITFESNTFYRGDYPQPSYNGAGLYIDADFLDKVEVQRNKCNALSVCVLERTPHTDGKLNIEYEEDIKKVENNPIEFTKEIKSAKVVSEYGILLEHVDWNSGTITTDVIKNDINMGSGINLTNRFACYFIGANWQGTNAANLGGYLVFVTILPNQQYKMVTVATDSTSGFASVPTIDKYGTLTIATNEYYRYHIQRIDILKTQK